MLGIKSLWPGASNSVMTLVGISKRVCAMSIVTPRHLITHPQHTLSSALTPHNIPHNTLTPHNTPHNTHSAQHSHLTTYLTIHTQLSTHTSQHTSQDTLSSALTPHNTPHNTHSAQCSHLTTRHVTIIEKSIIETDSRSRFSVSIIDS